MNLAWVMCRVLGLWRHEPVRHPLGGFRCDHCGLAGASLGELLKLDDHVRVERTIFDRDPVYPMARRAW